MAMSAKKVCIVTGSARGIGAACLREFADHGYAAIGLDVLPEGFSRYLLRLENGKSVWKNEFLDRGRNNFPAPSLFPIRLCDNRYHFIGSLKQALQSRDGEGGRPEENDPPTGCDQSISPFRLSFFNLFR